MENTLLLVFIGLVAIALIVIAAGIGLVAWYLSLFLSELTIVTKRLHEAGEVVAEDVSRLREQLTSGQFIYGLAKTIWPKKKTPRKSPPPPQE